MNSLPFFNICSESLQKMLGVKDVRSIQSRIREIGVPVYSKGKNSYIITEELLLALKKEDKKGYIYTPKNKANDFFN